MAEIIFDNNTDYDAVFDTVKLMFSDIKARTLKIPQSKRFDKILDEAQGFILIAEDDKEKERTARYESDVKVAYKLLYSIMPND